MFKTPKVDIYKLTVQMLPPSKRKNNFIAFFKGISSQLDRLNKIFKEFIYGSPLVYWDALITYDTDDEVVYNYKVYKSLIDGNIGLVGFFPDNSPTRWELILDSFIGIEESTRYLYQKLTLEWALNRYFVKELTDNGFTGFIQPNDPVTPTPSDIYIDNVVPVYNSFVIFPDEVNSSVVYSDRSSDYVFSTEILSGKTTYTFRVNIPTLVYSSINSNPDIADNIIRKFLNQYVPIGMYYIIEAY